MSHQNKIYYIKHLSHKEHLDLDEVEEIALNRAKEKNIPTEKDQLKFLIKHGLWSITKDNEIIQQKSYISRLNSSKKNILLPSILDGLLSQIKQAEDKILKLELERRDLLGMTRESFASKLVNDQYIVRSIFKDNLFVEPLFNEDTYENISDDDFYEISHLYNNSLDICNDTNIKKLTIQDFFQSYYFLCDDNAYSFFGKPIVYLTYSQLKLANHAKYFKYIFENNDIRNLPEDVREDPDKIIDYLDTTKKGKDFIDKQDGQMSSIVGMTKKDAELLGVKQDNKNSFKEIQDFIADFKRS